MSVGSLTSQRSMALRPCKASWDLGSLVKWKDTAWMDRTGKGERERRGKVNDRIRMELLLTFYCFFRSLSVCHGDHLALRKNAMFRQYWRAVNYFVVKLSDPTRRKYFFPVSEAEWVMHLIVMCHQLCQTRLSNKTWCVAHTSSRTLKSFIPLMMLCTGFVWETCFLLYLLASQWSKWQECDLDWEWDSTSRSQLIHYSHEVRDRTKQGSKSGGREWKQRNSQNVIR